MDWDLIWRLALTGFLAALIVASLVLYGSRALRRRSEPRPETWTAGHDEFDGKPRHWRKGAILDTVHSPTKNPRQDCPLCNPQPTSAPTSPEATETEEATQHGS